MLRIVKQAITNRNEERNSVSKVVNSYHLLGTLAHANKIPPKPRDYS